MSPELLFLIGTVAVWSGWICLARAALLGIRMAIDGGSDRLELGRRAVVCLAWATGILLIAQAVPMDLGRPAERGATVPLVWVLMSFRGWLAVGCFALAGIRAVQSYGGVTPAETRSRLLAAVAWLLAACGFIAWFAASGDEAIIFRGAIQLRATAVATVLALAVLCVAVMIRTERALKARGLATTIVKHATLLAGCVVFGIPFIWLLLTSFKEPRDAATTDGLVWVPKVQRTHPFMDPIRPLAEVTYQGRVVKAVIAGAKADGTLSLEIERPYNLRGRLVEAREQEIRRIARDAPVVAVPFEGKTAIGFVVEEMDGGQRRVQILEPTASSGTRLVVEGTQADPVRDVGLRWQNYGEALEYMPVETNNGLRYLQNTLVLVVMSVIGTVLSCSIVAYGFSRLRFPGRNALFGLMLATMMLPGAVTMLPTFLIFRSIGWIDTLLPIWVPAFFAGAFNVFLLRQFFLTIPMELEDAAKIDGCTYLRTFWQVMLPQIKPALAAITIWTFMGAWNNFMGPLIYISTPEKMPIAYALQLFQGERSGEYGLMMAFATMATLPVLLLFFFAQRYFIEGVQLSGLGGK